MQPISLATTDIFRGAYLLASGGDLAEIRVRNNGKRIATFLITGKDLDRLDRDYMTIPAEDIFNITPLMTVVGGRVVFESPDLQ